MSALDATTPSSTTGSSTGSPPSAIIPETPLSASFPDNNASSTDASAPASGNTGANPKRKSNRRANTAERRATHNAVERARRETLNGRFLDLAALLPQLASVRRPSKSAIVNSSIAIIHQARRTRLIAARELRLLRAESDAIRRENNEWRVRAGLPRVDEPTRSPEFMNLVNPQESEGSDGNAWDGAALGEMGEEERKAYELALNDKGDDDAMEDGEEDFVRMSNPNTFKPAPAMAPASVTSAQMAAYNQQQQQAQRQQPVQQPQIGFTRGHLGGFDMPSHPNLASGVQTMYEPSGMAHGASHSLPVHPDFHLQQFAQQARAGQDKFGSWDASALNMLAQQRHTVPSQWTHQFGGGPGSFTPPGSAHGPGSPMNGGPFFLQQQQQMYNASPEVDDASSVGSGEHITGSANGSPGPFEAGLMNAAPAPVAAPAFNRRPSLSLSLPGNSWAAQQLQSARGQQTNAMLSMMM